MPLGREVVLDPSDIVLHGDPVPPLQKGAHPPSLPTKKISPHVCCDQTD